LFKLLFIVAYGTVHAHHLTRPSTTSYPWSTATGYSQQTKPPLPQLGDWRIGRLSGVVQEDQ